MRHGWGCNWTIGREGVRVCSFDVKYGGRERIRTIHLLRREGCLVCLLYGSIVIVIVDS